MGCVRRKLRTVWLAAAADLPAKSRRAFPRSSGALQSEATGLIPAPEADERRTDVLTSCGRRWGQRRA